MNVVLVIALAVLVVDSRLRVAVAAYIAFTLATLVIAFPHNADLFGRILFFGVAIAKVVVGPAAILWLRHTRCLRQDLRPSFSLGTRLGVVILVLLVARAVGQAPAFSGVHSAALVFYAIVTSMCIVILHRSLLAHMVGLLVLGSAITLAGAIFAPRLPGGIELASTFDAVVATLVGVLIARAVAEYDPGLDIRELRQLRG